MSTPGLPAGPSTSTIWPSGLTWRDGQASSRATTLSPIPAAKRWRGRGNVEVVDKARIIRDDEVKVAGFLERANDRIVCALEDANHAPLATRRLRRASFHSARHVGDEAGHNAIAMHSRESVLTADVEVRLVRLSHRARAPSRWDGTGSLL